MRILYAAAVLVALSSACTAQELKNTAKFNIWSVVCKESAPKAACSIVAAVHSENEPGVWAKVGLSLSDSSDEIEIILRTPQLTFLKSGLSLGFDGKQFGRIFVEKCDASSCEATALVDSELRNLIGTRQKMTLEYPVSESEGVILSFDLDGIISALNYLPELEPTVYNSSGPVAATEGWHRSTQAAAVNQAPLVFSIELRSWPHKGIEKQGTTQSWNTPLKGCGNTPPVREIRVAASDMTIQNTKELTDWLDGAKKCGASSLVWVVPKDSPSAAGTRMALDRNLLGLYAIYESVKEQMPQVVISTDKKNRIPLQGSSGPTSLTYERSPTR